MISRQIVKKLRESTGTGIMECHRALVEARGDMDKALQIIKKKGSLIAQKKQSRAVKAGIVDSYVHDGRIGVLVEIESETDFVAKNPEFVQFVHDVAMQIASLSPKNTKELLAQSFIKNEDITIAELVAQKTAKFGENIQIKRFIRFARDDEY